MENSDNQKYKILTIILIVAIAAVIVFAIIPEYFPRSSGNTLEKIDFTNSTWIETYVENEVDLLGKDFYINSAFSYNLRSNKIVVTYASQNSVEEIREHYLTLPGAELSGRNDETSLNVTANIDGQNLRVYNFFSEISRVVELTLILNNENAELVIAQLENAFPEQAIAQISEAEEFLAGDIFGGYVRYDYDQFDGFAHPYLPIFSRAYFYDGSQEDFDRVIEVLNQAYPENRYSDSQMANYYFINDQIISITYLITDSGESLVTIGIQQEPN